MPLFSFISSIVRPEDVSAMMLRLVGAIAVLIIGIIGSIILSKLFRKLLHSFEIDSVLKEQGVKIPFEEFTSNIVKYLLYFSTVIWALNVLGLATTILQIILVVVFIIMIIFIILAFKDFIPNITAGFFIHSKGIIKQGDTVTIGAVTGKIISIDTIETRIKTKEKDMVFVPNAMLLKTAVVKKAGLRR
ncbi:MAG TPA: mechanosensitive ion channel [Nanoarchaeota archaeon]|nr:mechanosensitive ion channel [Nanoarchaeota archaeon]